MGTSSIVVMTLLVTHVILLPMPNTNYALRIFSDDWRGTGGAKVGRAGAEEEKEGGMHQLRVQRSYLNLDLAVIIILAICFSQPSHLSGANDILPHTRYHIELNS